MLHSLAAYYERHADTLPRPGWEMRSIHWAIVLDLDGNVVSLDDMRVDSNPIKLAVPSWPIRTSALAAGFLSDPAPYVLGVNDRRGVDKLSTWCEHNRSILADCTGPVASAILRWLTSWSIEAAVAVVEGRDLAGSGKAREAANITVMVGDAFAVADPEVAAAWDRHRDQVKGEPDVCAISGRIEPIELLHPGVIAGTGKLVSIDGDSDALHHYGRDDATASPIGRTAAHGYATALGALAAARQRTGIADLLIYYWSEADAAVDMAMSDAIDAILSGEAKPTDTEESAKLGEAVDAIRQGLLPPDVSPDTPYHLLAVAPGTGRHAIVWHARSTLGEFARRVADHVAALGMVRPPSARTILWAAGSKGEAIPSWLTVEMMRAIVEGRPYPITLAHRVLARLRAGDELTHTRAAILRAWTIRNGNREEEEMRNSVGYRIGTALHYAERMQLGAMPGVAVTVRDRLWSLLASRPQAGITRMFEGLRHHKSAMRRAGDGGLAEWLDNRIADALAGVELPAQLTMAEQADMALGYYDARARKGATAEQ